MILGLDISSNKTGVAILSDTGDLVHFECVDTQTNTKAKEAQFDDLFAKVDFLVDELSKLFDQFPISEIHIEEPLSKFQPGMSSMHTLQTLFKVNYVVTYELRKLSGIEPIYWNVRSIPGMIGVKIPKGENKKQLIYDYIKSNFPPYAKAVNDVLEAKQLKKLKSSSKSDEKPKKLRITDFPDTSPWIDISDAISIALVGYRNKTKLI